MRAVIHSRGQHDDREAKLLEQPCEQAVELVTEPASSPANDLVIERRNGKANRMAEMDVEILKRNGEQMVPVELPQRLNRWLP